MRRLQITPILIVLLFAIIFWISYCIVYLTQGYAEGAYITGMGTLILIGILIVERIVIKIIMVSRRLLWIYEIIAIILVFTIPHFVNPKIIYAQVEKEVQWFVVLETERQSEVDFKYRFPKHSSFKITRQVVFEINGNDVGRLQIEANNWKGNSSIPFTVNINNQSIVYRVYSNPEYELNEIDKADIERQVQKKLVE